MLALAGAALAAGLVLLTGAGFGVTIGGAQIRAHQPWPMLGVGAVAAAIAVWLGGLSRTRQDLGAAWDARDEWAPRVALAAAIVAVLTGLGIGTWTAGSADAYGYVSQSQLWRTGALIQAEPLASKVPWPQPEWSLSPLGYRPAAGPGAIVPTYPPGLPLVMAGASVIAGFNAVFWVVPLLGGLAVWMTYRLGRQIGTPVSGAVGALLLTLSPVFLYQIAQPMSDVPVTAWWTGALTGMLAGNPLVAGLCAAAAVLTRPNLVVLAAWLLLWLVWREHQAGRAWRAVTAAALRFAVPVAVAAGGLAVLNTHLYGHPWATGYGPAGAMFSTANVSINLRHNLGWLWSTQTPLVFAALLAPFLETASPPAHGGGIEPRERGRTPVVLRRSLPAVGFAGLVLASYLAYSPFEEWSYLRFLLPALPILLVLAADVLLRPLSHLPAAARLPAVTACVALLAGCYLVIAEQGGAMLLRSLEQRYAAAGAYVARAMPPSAVLFSVQESGPLRLYGQRTTIRFDFIEPDGLDRAVAFLQQAGCQPYFALEDWEEAQFRTRFAAAGTLGRLDWPPAAEIGGLVKVRLYDPRDRARYIAGEPIRTVKERAAPAANPR